MCYSELDQVSNKEYLITMKDTENITSGICSLTQRIYMYFKVVFRLVFVILNNAYCIPTYCIWMIMLLPLRMLYPSLYWRLEGLFFHWLLAMVSMWSWSAGYDIVEVGDDIRVCLNDRTLVIANHQSTSDVPMLMANFNARRNVLPNIMWVMDWVFKFTNFGIVSVIHQDFFILSGRKQRDQGIKDLRNHIRRSYLPRGRKLMVLFPEGGFLRKRKDTSQRYAEKNNLPTLTNVTVPRMGAFQVIVDELTSFRNSDLKPEDRLTWLLDITIAYADSIPLDLPTIIMGYRKRCYTYLCYRIYPISQVPKENDQMTKWLIERWQEKDQMLQHFYQTGQFPCDTFCNKPQQPHVVRQDALRFFILHAFFVASSYLHYQMILYAWNYLTSIL